MSGTWKKFDYSDGVEVFYKIDTEDETVSLKKKPDWTDEESPEVQLFFDEVEKVFNEREDTELAGAWHKFEYDDGADVFYKINGNDDIISFKKKYEFEEECLEIHEIHLFFSEVEEVLNEIKSINSLNKENEKATYVEK